MASGGRSLGVRDILGLPEFSGVRVLAGERGLDKEVTEVTTFECPDAMRSLHGKELVLTTLYSVGNQPADQVNCIQALSSVQASALAIQPWLQDVSISPEALAAAEALAFPVLLLPKTTRYATVFRAVVSAFVSQRAQLLGEFEQAVGSLASLLSSGTTRQDLAGVLARQVGRPVLVLDRKGNPAAYATPEPGVGDGGPNLTATAGREALRRAVLSTRVAGPTETEVALEAGKSVTVTLVPALAKGEALGYLAIPGRLARLSEMDHLLYALGAVVLGTLNIWDKYLDRPFDLAASVFEQILGEDQVSREELAAQGSLVGLNLDRPYGVMAVRAQQMSPGSENPASDGDRLYLMARQQLREIAPNCTVLESPDLLLVFVCLSRSAATGAGYRVEMTQWADRIKKTLTLSGRWPATRFGVSDVRASGWDTRRGRDEAVAVLDAAASLGLKGDTLFATDLGPLLPLLLAREDSAATAGWLSIIEPVAAYDRENSADLLATLEAYLDNGASHIRTARALYAHPNTVRYRLRKITELLGDQVLADPARRLGCHLATKLRRVLTAARSDPGSSSTNAALGSPRRSARA